MTPPPSWLERFTNKGFSQRTLSNSQLLRPILKKKKKLSIVSCKGVDLPVNDRCTRGPKFHQLELNFQLSDISQTVNKMQAHLSNFHWFGLFASDGTNEGSDWIFSGFSALQNRRLLAFWQNVWKSTCHVWVSSYKLCLMLLWIENWSTEGTIWYQPRVQYLWETNGFRPNL